MIVRVLILSYLYQCILAHTTHPPRDYTLKSQKCLIGDMTEMQSWVDAVGNLLVVDKERSERAIDLSARASPVPILQQTILMIRTQRQTIKYLSFARCQLTKVPPIFNLQDNLNRNLFDMLEYVSFYGNSFVRANSAGEQYTTSFNATGARPMNVGRTQTQVANVWSSGFTGVTLTKLKELDLRACSIQALGQNLFDGMPNLEALYIGENEISFIASTALRGLNNLKHLDFSKNQAHDENGNSKLLNTGIYHVFENLINLVSLDLSYTKLTPRNQGMLWSLGKSVKSLSLCECGLTGLPDGILKNTSLQVLDLSRNSGILNFGNTLKGLENTLTVLNAKEVALFSMQIFRNFTKLEMLQISYNEISTLPEDVIRSMKNLQVLDLNKNRITSWFEPTFSLLPRLKYLSLKDNNINIITETMIEDIMNVDYLAMSGNFMVCNCHAKDFYKMAYKNERLYNDTLLKMPNGSMPHNGYVYYNKIIQTRMPVDFDCDRTCFNEIEETGRFRIVDYSHPRSYICLLVPESRSVSFSDVISCAAESRQLDLENELASGRRKLLALIFIPCFLLPLVIAVLFRRHIRYFFITMRNSAMLSLINKKEIIDSDKIFNYDVFVSYCNEDRNWVLDHLLPHMESECSISACLHERDFQVGLSILENIVSCMDRSRSIMLIISKQFLLSQWCQFEMHLAQHRLLETRRENLTLILLEEIPRRLRPNTLHYLMLTKTYIVWPKEESERHIFWKRLKKTLISSKNKHRIETVSLA